MNRILPLLASALLVAALLGANLTAQEAPVRLAFVDSQALIAAHPSGQQANDLRALASQEIGELANRLDTLQAKARSQGLSVEEADLFNVLLSTFESVQARYTAEINAAAQPAIQAVNNAIRDVATELGVAVVMDIEAAAQSGLVVYAADGLDITEAVSGRVR
jgi:outer membrane protein